MTANLNISPTLLTYCFVQEAFEVSHDIVSSLTPLFEPIAIKRAGQRFDPQEFILDVQQYYGIDIPELVIDEFGNRLYQNNLLEILKPDKYAPVFKYLDSYESEKSEHDSEVIREIGTQIEKMSNHIYEYVKEKITDLESREIVDKALYEVIVSQSFQELFESSPDEIVAKDEGVHQEVRKLVAVSLASYLSNLEEHEPENFQTILKIFEGALLSQVVLTIRKPPTVGVKSHALTIMLDTQLVIRLLGFDGAKWKKSADELVKAIHSIGAKCGMYREHSDELHGLLTAIVRAAEQGTLDPDRPIGVAIARSPYLMAKASEYLRRTDSLLKENGVYVTDVLGDYPQIVKHVPLRWQNGLRDQIRPGGAVANRDADAAAVCHTIRLTRSRRAQETLKAAYIFASNDQALIRLADREIRESGFLTSGEITYAVTDTHLATLLWIAVGSTNFSLPRMTLLANCSSALTPSSGLLTRVRSLLSNSSKKEQEELEALFTDKRCAYYLTSVTGNDYKFVTQENFTEILDGMRRQLAADLEEEKRRDLEEIGKKNTETIIEIEGRAGEDRAGREKAEQKNALLVQQNRDQETRIREKDRRVVDDALEFRRRFELIMSTAVGLFLSAAAFSLAYYLAKVTDSVWWWLLLIPTILIPVITFGKLGDTFINHKIRNVADSRYLARCKKLGVFDLGQEQIRK